MACKGATERRERLGTWQGRIQSPWPGSGRTPAGMRQEDAGGRGAQKDGKAEVNEGPAREGRRKGVEPRGKKGGGQRRAIDRRQGQHKTKEKTQSEKTQAGRVTWEHEAKRRGTWPTRKAKTTKTKEKARGEIGTGHSKKANRRARKRPRTHGGQKTGQSLFQSTSNAMTIYTAITRCDTSKEQSFCMIRCDRLLWKEFR